MLKSLLMAVAVFSGVELAAATPAYTATPLRSRAPLPPGAKPFETLDPAEIGVTVPNVFSDPRMWGDRFRELTLGSVETGIAVADFDRDGRPDIFVVSKNSRYLGAIVSKYSPNFSNFERSNPESQGVPSKATTIGSTAGCEDRSAKGASAVSIMSTPASIAFKYVIDAIPLV